MKPYRNERNLSQHAEIVRNTYGPQALPHYLDPRLAKANLMLSRSINAALRASRGQVWANCQWGAL